MLSCVVRGVNVPITENGFKLTAANSKIESESATCTYCGKMSILGEEHASAISAEFVGVVQVMDECRKVDVALELWRDPRGGLFALEQVGPPVSRLIASPFALGRHILLKR